MLAWQQRYHPLLAPLGAAYGGLMRARRNLFESGLLPAWAPDKPCVSVGNIAWGGSGKTPLAAWLLSWACGQALNPVLLTRGYGAKPPKTPFLVTTESPPGQAGDEPLMLAKSCPNAKVVVDPKRARSGPWAEKELAPDLFVLDDGMQHLAARRHRDIVLLKPSDLDEDWDRVIPAGPWRESACALARADAFAVKAPVEQFVALKPRLEARLAAFEKPVFGFGLAPRGIRSLGEGVSSRGALREDLGGKPYLLVTGVAEPAQVEATAKTLLGYAPERVISFPDHHPYTEADINRIGEAARAAWAECVLTTPKDAVKLEGRLGAGHIRLCVFDLELDFHHSLGTAEAFPAWWQRQWMDMHNSML